MRPYAPRRIRHHGVRTSDGWSLKLYSVVYDRSRPLDWDGFEPALRLAETSLPHPDPARGRPGLGFLIAHQGLTGDYVVLAWWDRENEMPLRVWVRSDRADWHAAADDESVCVWDLEIVWAERGAWIECMLGAGGPRPADYLERVAPPRCGDDEALAAEGV